MSCRFEGCVNCKILADGTDPTMASVSSECPDHDQVSSVHKQSTLKPLLNGQGPSHDHDLVWAINVVVVEVWYVYTYINA